MDEKLARGYTRELFRQLGKISTHETDPAKTAVEAALLKYLAGAGVPDSALRALGTSFASRLAEAGARVDRAVYVPHPVNRKYIVQVTRPGRVVGTEQDWAIARSNTYVFQSKRLDIVETSHHAAVSRHAVKRLFERADMEPKQIATVLDQVTLWTPTLLLALYSETPGSPEGTQVVVPVFGGLLLGSVEFNRITGPEEGPTVTAIRRGGPDLTRIKAPFEFGEGWYPTISINTFVSRDELFRNQIEIADNLSKFQDTKHASMSELRAMCALGYPNPEVTRLLGRSSFTDDDAAAVWTVKELLQLLFQTTEWKTQVESHRGRWSAMQ